MRKSNEIKIDSARLKCIRQSMDYTQKEMANRLGISETAYCGKEKGRFYFSESEKLMLKDIFNLSFDEFDDILYGGILKSMRS